MTHPCTRLSAADPPAAQPPAEAAPTEREDAASVADSRQALARELPRIPPKSPQEAVETFRALDRFRMELVAAEPLVSDPVAIKYDENGRMWVAEMADYPYSDKSLDRPYEDQPSLPLGRIRVLEDEDGDGRYDRSTVFAEDLSWPTGLALWKGGIYVTATPDILYLKDTDGDGKADVRRKVFTGFRKYNVQAVINNLQWGLDHHIYGAGSSNGGLIEHGGDADRPAVRMGRADFRFAPDAEVFEVLAGGGRFGNTFDAWGNRFLCNIRNPVQHVVLEDRYLARNPYLPVRSGVHDSAPSGAVEVFRASPPEPWRVVSAQRKASDPDDTSPGSEKAAVGFVTSASGITIYRGAAYPARYANNAFVGEVAGNLVMRYVLRPDGPAFSAERIHGETEFLASTDNWFRPVNFVNAPDGTLHVVDMYRETIEHPWSIPDDIKALLDLRSGHRRGRIYRLVSKETRDGFSPPPAPRLGDASTDDLVSQLENPHGWWRETAHRLIFERQDQTAVPALRQLLRTSSVALARLHALWSLEGLGALEDQDLQQALGDEAAGVRRHAVRLAEQRLGDSPELAEQVIDAARDPDVQVRYQAALALGELTSDETSDALLSIARRDGTDPWSRTAVLSSLSERGDRFVLRLLADREFATSPAGRAVLDTLAYTLGVRKQLPVLRNVLAKLTESELPDDLSRNLLGQIGAGLKRGGVSLRELPTAEDSEVAALVNQFLANASTTALDGNQPVEQRVEAVERLAYEQFEEARGTLKQLLDPREPQAVQMAAAETVAGFPHPNVAELLLDRYDGLTPDVRRQVVTSLLSRTERIPPLLSAIEQRRVSATLVSPVRRLLLTRSSDATVRQRALQVFEQDAPGPRGEVIERFEAALSLPGRADRGEAVFRRECAACHRLGEVGKDIGPNLATVRHRSAKEILVHVLDPNREVSPNYLEYIVASSDGRVATGVIAAETATSVTLRSAENKETTILRREIDAMKSSGKSLMPEGLEKKLTVPEMADLLAFILGSVRRQ